MYTETSNKRKFLLVLISSVASVVLVACATTISVAPEPAVSSTPTNPLRPPIMGRNAGVSAGHPLTTAAALEILQQGGNAFDAGVAALLVGGVVEQDLYGIGGEALILVYPEHEQKVTSVTGQGWAPAAANVADWLSAGKTLEGQGLDASVVPGAMHAALTVLERWGTMSFEMVSRRAIEYAEHGFPLRGRTANAIKRDIDFINQWSGNQRYWLKQDGSFYEAGENIRFPGMAQTFKRMLEAEHAVADESREAGVVAARNRFYQGDIAVEMVEFLQDHGAPYELADFAEYYARVEEPVSTTYKNFTVYKQPFNSQGPMLLQTLNILENFDLQEMGHNSADYTHVLVEAMKLAYADRDTFYADQDFVDLPAIGLLSKAYAKERAQSIDMGRASQDFVAGNPLPFDPNVKSWPYWKAGEALPIAQLSAELHDFPESAKDTSHIAIIDEAGNVFDSTPSGGWIGGAVILGDTGIGMSVRGEQFWLDERRAQQLRPRSRPRYTLTPSIVFQNGKPLMAVGTPGGDNQEQTILQTFLNVTEFWPSWYPNLHAAIEWPRVQTLHFYQSFWPHTSGFNRVNLEVGIGQEVIEDMKNRGHDVNVMPPFRISGCATAVLLDPETGNRIAAADPRRDCYAIAY